MSNDDEVVDFHPENGHLLICKRNTFAIQPVRCNRDCTRRLLDLAKRLLPQDEGTAPECDGHNELQRHDGKPPWCSRCGWTRGQPAMPARKIGPNAEERALTSSGHRPWTPEGGYIGNDSGK